MPRGSRKDALRISPLNVSSTYCLEILPGLISDDGRRNFKLFSKKSGFKQSEALTAARALRSVQSVVG
jgi:hypothetical protein